MDADKNVREEAKIVVGLSRRKQEEGVSVKCKCKRCKWKWTSKPRPECPRPVVCPKCHSYLWDRERIKKGRRAAKSK